MRADNTCNCCKGKRTKQKYFFEGISICDYYRYMSRLVQMFKNSYSYPQLFKVKHHEDLEMKCTKGGFEFVVAQAVSVVPAPLSVG